MHKGTALRYIFKVDEVVLKTRTKMHLFISLVMAVAPSLLLVCYYYKQDMKKPEPKHLVTKIFLLGIAFTIPAIILEMLFDEMFVFVMRDSIIYHLFKAFIVAALIEEVTKLLIVKWFVYDHDQFDEVMDGIVYTIMASLGFACLENIIYVIDGGFTIALVRAITAVPMHAVASGMMGYYIGKAKFSEGKQDKKSMIYKGLGYAVLIHGIYDFLLFASPKIGFILALGVFPLIIFTFMSLKEKISLAIAEDDHAGRH
jgi:RsiW-degrading membrane proteinase PrsW (M82 family)